jgi:hypothetical protein
VLAARNIVALWRAKPQKWRWPAWWVRGLPVVVVIGWAFVLGALIGLAGMASSGTAADLLAFVFLLVLLLIVASVVVWVGVITLNRPKFAVPPHLRDQPGLLESRAPRQQSR